MRIISCCALLYSVFVVVDIQPFVDIHAKNVRRLKQQRKQYCYISFVSVDGQIFLVKQKRKMRDLLAVVHDTLAAHIAQGLDIAHRVAIIPAFYAFPGKICDTWPATIHTLASGATIKDKRSAYRKMNIKQAAQGFRREMIPWMARHEHLIKVLALDIFLCNHDRHRGNLFYDAKTDKFCAIDMDLLYEHNLPLLAHQNLLRMAEYDLFPLTAKELFALFELRKTLQFLVNNYHPEDTLFLFNQLIQEAGLGEDSLFRTKRTTLKIDLTRRLIVQSYKDTILLIQVLADVIKRGIELMPGLRSFQVIADFEKQYEHTR